MPRPHAIDAQAQRPPGLASTHQHKEVRVWSGFPETKASVEDAQNLVPFAMPMGASPRPFVQREISNLRLLLGIGVLS